MMVKFSPAQQEAFDLLMHVTDVGNVIVLYGNTGLGKSTVLREAHRRLGGAFLNMKDLIEAMRDRNPMSLEETFERLVRDALETNDVVIVDDLHLLNSVTCCSHFYPRMGLLNAPLTTLCTVAAETGRKLIFGSESKAAQPLNLRAFNSGIAEFEIADYEFLCRQFLDEEVANRLDYKKIHRFATKLNAHQIKSACLWLKQDQQLDTERFIDYLRSQRLASNVDLSDVEAVDIHHLKGVDDVIRSLEANIIVPLENDELATELNLKPKRGVLLVGPPGTGKTTIGRALAHRLKSKFFLIDGTFISGTNNFYGNVHQVFEAAKQNAPSIIFIDDSDAIFESGEELGLYRYLLTILDGLENQSAGRVCLMMTAMDIGNLPPALVRSGRIELWLEMHLPNKEARSQILSENLRLLPQIFSTTEVATLVDATEGFTGADLKRLVEDGKTLYAYDKVQNVPQRSTTEYFLAAIETVQANKQKYAEADARARQQRAVRPQWYQSANQAFTFFESLS